MSFILAGFVFLFTVVVSILVFFADAMRDTTGQNGTDAFWIFGVGTTVSGLLVASHWLHMWW